MTVTTTKHVNFRGDARAALEFYRSVFGGQVIVMTYADMSAVQGPAEAEQIMWGQVAADSGFRRSGLRSTARSPTGSASPGSSMSRRSTTPPDPPPAGRGDGEPARRPPASPRPDFWRRLAGSTRRSVD